MKDDGQDVFFSSRIGLEGRRQDQRFWRFDLAKIDVLLDMMIQHGASDLHICAGDPPMLRIDGRLQRVKYHDLTPEEAEAILLEMLDEDQVNLLKARMDIDFAYALEGKGRFRANVFMERKGYGGAFQLIPTEIKTLRELMLPESIHVFAQVQSGLVLVTGPTGSGKSTTLAAMIDLINSDIWSSYSHAGKVMLKVVPFSTSLSTPIVPL
jgi:twitching motility protein PilT